MKTVHLGFSVGPLFYMWWILFIETHIVSNMMEHKKKGKAYAYFEGNIWDFIIGHQKIEKNIPIWMPNCQIWFMSSFLVHMNRHTQSIHNGMLHRITSTEPTLYSLVSIVLFCLFVCMCVCTLKTVWLAFCDRKCGIQKIQYMIETAILNGLTRVLRHRYL